MVHLDESYWQQYYAEASKEILVAMVGKGEYVSDKRGLFVARATNLAKALVDEVKRDIESTEL